MAGHLKGSENRGKICGVTIQEFRASQGRVLLVSSLKFGGSPSLEQIIQSHIALILRKGRGSACLRA